ncbi:thimet oligopeptidase [Acinetobacter calcoaceticus]|uniref:Thimet oligopeptidase n=1 Tax=Acinetobacter calcoaceticus TaxID=471 RepID=A0A4R1XYS0_ACICA|nr:thimet oligopeptidase [Acinetobacter calcoaceticus]
MKIKSVKFSLIYLCMFSLLSPEKTLAAEPVRTELPLFKASQIPQLCESNINQVNKKILEIENSSSALSSESALVTWDKLFANFEDFYGAIGIYSNVDPDPKLRKAAEECEIKINQLMVNIFQNPKLYHYVKSAQAADEIDQKYRVDVLDQFERTGVQLSAEKAKRLKEILDELTKIEQVYARNIRDNPKKLAFSPAEMKGLPKSYLSNLSKDKKGHYLLGFEYPEYSPFMQLAENDAARKRYQTAFTRRGTDSNLALLKRAIDLRYEQAQLFDLPSYADLVLKNRMAQNPQAVNQFLAEIKVQVAPLEKKEVAALSAFKAETLKIPVEQAVVERWSEAYWSEKLKQAQFKIDQEQLRKYFPTTATKKWLFAISENLYGIKFVPIKLKSWHKEVEYYDVIDSQTDQFLGGLYMDMFPRAGKYGHAAVWSVRGGSTLLERKPISVLVTNFNRDGLNSNELETFVHEFGHALHGILSNTRYAGQSGTSVERDFVEAPSQMYEEWARREESLSKIADYCDPECPRVDGDLVQRLTAAHNYGQGLHYARQTLYAQYDMALHAANASQLKPLELWKQMESQTALGYVATSQFPGQFGHLMGGYQAGYYGYMWSEVLALDMLSVFEGNLNNPVIGQRYRQMILSEGSQKPTAQIVRQFIGREPNKEAFFKEISGQRVK